MLTIRGLRSQCNDAADLVTPFNGSALLAKTVTGDGVALHKSARDCGRIGSLRNARPRKRCVGAGTAYDTAKPTRCLSSTSRLLIPKRGKLARRDSDLQLVSERTRAEVYDPAPLSCRGTFSVCEDTARFYLSFPKQYRPRSSASEDWGAEEACRHRKRAGRAALPTPAPTFPTSRRQGPCGRSRRGRCRRVTILFSFRCLLGELLAFAQLS